MAKKKTGSTYKRPKRRRLGKVGKAVTQSRKK